MDGSEISIVICTRNRGGRLQPMLDALGAVRSDRVWNVLIVDNASTDETPAMLARADDLGGRLRTLRCERIGLGAARDAGWRATMGGIVAFTDDDCYLAPDYIDRLAEVFDERPELACVGGGILLHDPDDAPVTIDERMLAEDVAPYRFVPLGAVQGANFAVRRNALAAIGGVDPDLGAGTPFPCEDIDVVAALAWAGFASTFDPRPVVAHHHGRKARDVPALMASYDRGRGAYFAKYLLRRDSRAAYRRGWVETRFHNVYRGSLAVAARELSSAVRYLVHRRAFAFLIAATPVALYWTGALAWRIAVNKLRAMSRPGARQSV